LRIDESLDGLPTVCVSANCPNIGECWSRGTATFMIMGDTCTRACRFCNVMSGKPGALNPHEPQILAESVAKMGLKYAVLTCVDRDDLPDFGAAHWAACIGAVRRRNPGVKIETLIGDMRGREADIATVVRACPDVLVHNVETVPRLQHIVRHPANWANSTRVLVYGKEVARTESFELLTKTGMMFGLGETKEEVKEAMALLRDCDIDLLTLSQYLKPNQSERKWEVQRYVHPDEFAELAEYALSLGFQGVMASPLTRSSYRAETLYYPATSSGEE
jgi:lipoic acid synthetase